MANNNAAKRLAFETLLDQGKVRVHFVLCHEKVQVPDKARAQSMSGHLALDYSKRFVAPMNLKVTDEGVSATLVFGVAKYMTFVPWEAVTDMGLNGKLMESWHDAKELHRKWLQGIQRPSAVLSDVIVLEEDDGVDAKWLSSDMAEG